MEKCPNCNAKIKESIECYRCGFDFSHVIRCEKTAERFYFQALTSLKKGEIDQAQDFTEKAIILDNTPRYRKLNTYLLLKKMYHV